MMRVDYLLVYSKPVRSMPPLPFWGFLALAIEGLKKENYISLKPVKGRWGSRILRCGMATVGEGGALPFPRQ
jgi:hypothetical protein